MRGLWRVAAALALVGATSSACIGDCGDSILLVSGDYTIGELLYDNDDASDDWTHDTLPGAQMTIDLASNTATIIYEREGTTYQVVYELEK